MTENTETLMNRHRDARDIAQQAALKAKSFFDDRNELKLETKGVHEFVSHADRAVEQLIRERLTDLRRNDAVLGEEFGGDKTKADYWAIDPIDGTANFMRGSPLWGVSIAYVQNHVPVVGCIILPIMGIELSAYLGSGLLKDGQKIERDEAFSDVPICAVGENWNWSGNQLPIVEHILRKSGWGVASYRCATVGLSFAALGYVDGYVEDRTSVWDLAAGVVLANEAGLSSEFDVKLATGSCFVATAKEPLFEIIRNQRALKSRAMNR